MVDTMKDRVIGLPRQIAKPLLSTFQSVPETKMEDVEDYTAPPESSDDESEAPPTAACQDSDSEDGWQRQKDMKSTKFGPGKRSRSPERGAQRSVRAKTTASSSRGNGGRPIIRAPGRAQRAKLSPDGAEGEHFTDELGFLKRSKSNKSKNTFSGKNSQRSSQASAPKSPPPQGLLSGLHFQTRYS